ncbi:MAG: hypothetical protein AB8B74_03190 [Crocinitomicaceae bacterium]
MKQFHKLILTVVLFASFSLFGQDGGKTKTIQSFPISISVLNHSWAFPGSQVYRIVPLYPGIAIGSEYQYKKWKKTALYQVLEIGGFLNNSAGSGIYVNTNIGFRGITNFGLMTEFSLGLGYFQGFYPSNVYSLAGSGVYEQVKGNGIGALSSNINFQLGYQIKKSKRQLTPYIGYQFLASTYYWSLITIRPNGLLKAGIRFNLK